MLRLGFCTFYTYFTYFLTAQRWRLLGFLANPYWGGSWDTSPPSPEDEQSLRTGNGWCSRFPPSCSSLTISEMFKLNFTLKFWNQLHRNIPFFASRTRSTTLCTVNVPRCGRFVFGCEINVPLFTNNIPEECSSSKAWLLLLAFFPHFPGWNATLWCVDLCVCVRVCVPKCLWVRCFRSPFSSISARRRASLFDTRCAH